MSSFVATFLRSLTDCFRSNSTKRSAGTPRFRPGVAMPEDRLVPSATWVSETESNNTTSDSNSRGYVPSATGLSIISGSISSNTDRDVFYVIGGSGTRVWALVDAGFTNNTSRDSYLTVSSSVPSTPGPYGPNIHETDDDNGTESGAGGPNDSSSLIAGRQIPGSAHYYLTVEEYLNDSTISNYNLYAQLTYQAPNYESGVNSTPANADWIGTPGGLLRRAWVDNGHPDYYRFSATAGDRVFIAADADLDRDHSGSAIWLELLAPNGQTVLFTSKAAAASTSGTDYAATGFAFAIPASGTYYVRVATTSGPMDAAYDLLVSGNTPWTPPAPVVAPPAVPPSTAALVVKASPKKGGPKKLVLRLASPDGRSREIASPFQKPAFRAIAFLLVDTNSDGAADAVRLTAFQGKKKVTSRLYSL